MLYIPVDIWKTLCLTDPARSLTDIAWVGVRGVLPGSAIAIDINLNHLKLHYT